MEYRVFRFGGLESTNLAASGGGYVAGDVVVAEFQSGGRGQQGAVWQSAGGANLLMSLVLEPSHIRVSEQFWLSELASVAVAAALNHFLRTTPSTALIKWPNDVIITRGDGAVEGKIAGILIENSFCSEWLGRCVVGIGVNIAQREWDHPERMPLPPTSLALAGVEGVSAASVDEFLEKLLLELNRAMELPRGDLAHIYMEQLWRAGEWARFYDHKHSAEITAKIQGVCPHSGELTLALHPNSGGGLRRYLFKEITHII